MLAGGFGTRLRTVVSDVPKPLAPVSGKPFLQYLIEHWRNQGVSDLVILLHYEADKVQLMLDRMRTAGNLDGLNVRTIVERIPLGTGGSVANAVDQLNLKDSFLVANADTWIGTGVKEIATVAPCALGAVKVPNCERYGSLVLRERKVLKFQEKKICHGAGWINAGLYHLTPSIFEQRLKQANFSLEDHIFPSLIAKDDLVGVPLETDFIDIGISEDYLRFCDWIQSGQVNEL